MSRLQAAFDKLEPTLGIADTEPDLQPHTETVLEVAKRKLNTLLVSLRDPSSPDAENYRRLRHAVEKLKRANEGLVIGITSPLPGDGKTLTALNLAGALAQNPQAKVLLLELDLRHPFTDVNGYLGIRKPAQTGVVDLLLDAAVGWEHASYYLPEFNLHVMPSGRASQSPYELLASERMGEVLKQARQRYDYVIVDTAPVVLLPDSQLLSERVDGYIVVVAADTTTRRVLEAALDLMDRDKVLGMVFNGFVPASDDYGYKAYY